MAKTEYKVGDIWMRAGRRREIAYIIKGDEWHDQTKRIKSVQSNEIFFIQWKRPGGTARISKTWCTTWNDWVAGAELVYRK